MGSFADFEVNNCELDVQFGSSFQGEEYPDGNNIVYPVLFPATTNVLYKEEYIDNIARTLGKRLKVSEMADAIETIVERDGLFTFGGSAICLEMNIQVCEYQVIS